jgi:hypothetical protein
MSTLTIKQMALSAQGGISAPAAATALGAALGAPKMDAGEQPTSRILPSLG